MKLLFSGMLSILSLAALADNPITGNTSVQPGATETYTVNWDNWSSVFENYANVSWYVSKGTILASDKHTVTIQWDEVPPWQNETGSIDVYEDLGGGSGNLNVQLVNFAEGVLETCNGVLGNVGNNIVNFGAGPNPGLPLPAGVTTYTYEGTCSSVTPGEYTITNSTVNCNPDWLQLPADHTPLDQDGYMLLVDGREQRGEVYRQTVNGLTDAFEYEFSVWVANLSDPQASPPNENPHIAFELYDLAGNRISGSGFYTIDYDPNNPWRRISFMFPLPPGTTSVQIVIVNDHNDYNGNDFVVDDIGFAPCYSPIIASFSPNPTITTKSYTCNNGTVNLYSWWPTPTVPYSNPSFKWQRIVNNGSTWTDIPGATTMNYTRTENTPGRYYFRIYAYETANPSQFVVSNTITYFVQQMVVDLKTFYVNGCTSSTVELNPTYSLQFKDDAVSGLSYTFNWAPGTNLSNTQIANPTITLPALPPPNPPNPPNPLPPINYTYTLTVQNTNYGCTGSNTQIVAHLNPRKVYFFTGFTPNNDGVNDYFFPINIWDYTHFGAEFWIYNRWGQLVHYRNQGATVQDWRWDGTVGGIPQNGDVYVFMVKIPDCPTNYGTPLPYGVTYENGIIRGTCTLIR